MTLKNHIVGANKKACILTRESARAARACYSDERIAELVPPEGLTPAQVAALDIPEEDRHWALVDAMGADDVVLRLHAVWCARRNLSCMPNPDPRSSKAIDAAERYALGTATKEEMEDALAYCPSVEWDAACDAACDVAFCIASVAASNAAWAAARRVTWRGERAFQLRDLVSRLESDE